MQPRNKSPQTTSHRYFLFRKKQFKKDTTHDDDRKIEAKSKFLERFSNYAVSLSYVFWLIYKFVA
jgi:hypothetical protein